MAFFSSSGAELLQKRKERGKEKRKKRREKKRKKREEKKRKKEEDGNLTTTTSEFNEVVDLDVARLLLSCTNIHRHSIVGCVKDYG